MTRKKDTSDEPYVDNYPPLHAWVTKMMDEHDARWAWQTRLNNGMLECLQVGAHAVIILVYPRKHGWDIFTRTTDSPNIAETLAAVEKRIGVWKGPEGT